MQQEIANYNHKLTEKKWQEIWKNQNISSRIDRLD